MTVRAFLGLGSNVGDRWQYLTDAVARLPDVVRISPVYETDPVGGPDGQSPYLNLVVELSTDRSPRQLLEEAQAAEASAGRERTVRFGPRTLDVDVLLVGDQVVNDSDLIIPHPRMWERAFVLVPLRDLAPELARDLVPELAPDIGGDSVTGVRPAGPLG